MFQDTWLPILMMSAKLATLRHFKKKTFLNEGYDVIISVHNVTKKNYQLAQIIF